MPESSCDNCPKQGEECLVDLANKIAAGPSYKGEAQTTIDALKTRARMHNCPNADKIKVNEPKA